jgi:predicted MPP superfamily phosphohydrolase
MTTLLLAFLLLGSQIYWAVRIHRAVSRCLTVTTTSAICAGLFALYLALIIYNGDRLMGFPRWGPQPNPARLGFADATLAMTQWWLLCSLIAFVLALPIGLYRALVRAVRKARPKVRRPPPQPGESTDRPIMPQRRQFLEQAAAGVLAAPFVAGGYALLYGRLNLQIAHQQIRVPRLPKQFHGLRMVQLSDIHISSFMSEDQIRKFAAIANSLRADLIALTGDFVTWDPSVERNVVNALSGLKAPLGVFGCLGNHDAWAGVKDSITSLFASAGITILRDACIPISHDGAQLNLIGIEPEYGWNDLPVPSHLTSADRPNILMSHYPTVFDRAATCGIDLMISGHTHGGQVKLDFISPHLAPKLLRTPYIAGKYTLNAAQLYVNRGIGTILVPMRAGMPPEITVLELVA